MTIRIVDIHIVVVILPIFRALIIRRINVDAVNFSGVEIFQQLQGMVIVGFNESVPQVAVRSITNAVHLFQTWEDWITEFGNDNQIFYRQRYGFMVD